MDFSIFSTKVCEKVQSEISSLYPSFVAVQPGLCRTWSETPKTGFLTTRLILLIANSIWKSCLKYVWCLENKINRKLHIVVFKASLTFQTRYF